ncbi:MAG: hypothetical protein K9H49_07275 [Bacteroidales bacterium]|nr:hypothetical protein [Bacteroidales bacterium]MCF8390313.1 hypothetical protein [Bacteroidales bacterium]
MKKLLLLLIVTLLFTSANSQNILKEAGIRGGQTAGFTYRYYLDDYLSYEGILSFRKSGMQFTLLRQFHEQENIIEFGHNFQFIHGYGGHAGFFFTDRYSNFGYQSYYSQKIFSPVVGIDGYAAVEYRLESYPIVFGIDYKPFFELSVYQFFKLSLWDVAFTLKYRF